VPAPMGGGRVGIETVAYINFVECLPGIEKYRPAVYLSSYLALYIA